MTEADVIIIGSGPGGYSTAARAAASGSRVVLIEQGELGGTCLNRGCIPTKALVASADVAMTVARAADFGVMVDGSVTFDYARAAARKDAVVAELREGVATLLAGVTVVKARARFTPEGLVEANGELFSAPRIIVATGSRPASLPVAGAELAVDSDFALAMTGLPESVIIIGGGVIGMEFASIYAAFGVKVSVVEFMPEILPPFDSDIARRLRTCLKRRGVEIITGARVTAIAAPEPDAPRTVTFEAKGKSRELTASMVLMAVGRRPVLPEGLDRLCELDARGFVKVGPDMATTAPGIYAVGDVNGLCMLAHAAEAQGLVALGTAQRLDVVPSAVFTAPECAMVGLTEQQCERHGMECRVTQAGFRANGKAMAMGQTDGLVKVVTDPRGVLLGCHICGPHASDLVQEAATLMSAKPGAIAADLAGAIHGHPTLGETLRAACH